MEDLRAACPDEAARPYLTYVVPGLCLLPYSNRHQGTQDFKQPAGKLTGKVVASQLDEHLRSIPPGDRGAFGLPRECSTTLAAALMPLDSPMRTTPLPKWKHRTARRLITAQTARKPIADTFEQLASRLQHNNYPAVVDRPVPHASREG